MSELKAEFDRLIELTQDLRLRVEIIRLEKRVTDQIEDMTLHIHDLEEQVSELEWQDGFDDDDIDEVA